MPDIVALADAQAWMANTDDSPGPLLQTVVSAASDLAIAYLQWNPVVQTLTEYYSGKGSGELIVNRKGIQSVAWLAWLDASGNANPMDLTAIWTDGATIGSRYQRFPLGRKNIAITYTAGLSPMPGGITLAVQQTISAIWRSMNSDQHTPGENYAGVIATSYWQTGPGALPPQAVNNLKPYRLTYLST